MQASAAPVIPPLEAHGQCFGFAGERNAWPAPSLTYSDEHAARPGYDALTASEYRDEPEVLAAKVRHLAGLVTRARCVVVFAGAGLSTSAGIDDYATRRGATDGEVARLRSPLCAQPTLAHRVLVGLHASGRLYRLIQQNHDGLPQKAGLPQTAVNEIHGALHDPSNPVVPMSGSLRDDLMKDLLECEERADLVLAIGTSLAGMNADRIVHTAAARAGPSQAACLGAVIIGLQRTVHDAATTLRIFGTCDEVLSMLGDELALGKLVPPARPVGSYFRPAVLLDGGDDAAYVLRSVPYDAMGRRRREEEDDGAEPSSHELDLRDGAALFLPSGPHAGARGEVDGLDREGNPRCRFQLRLRKGGSFKAPSVMPLGTWWVQAAADGSVAQLPVVNLPRESDRSEAAAEARALLEAYA